MREGIRRTRTPRGWREAHRPYRTRSRRPRAVSTIVATILLLAISVTLFGLVFFAVQVFPRPPSPNVSQFSARLTFMPGGSAITAVSITHLSGPPVTGSTGQQAAIYITSLNRSTTYGPLLLSQGLNLSSDWVYGQTWSCSSTCVGFPSLFAPDNVTVKVVAQGALLFQTSLQALFPGFAPYFSGSSAAPIGGGTFQGKSPSNFEVKASIVCSASCKATDPVTLNYSQFIGYAVPTVNMICSPAGAASESCTYTSSGNVTSPSNPGTYYLFLVATDSLDRTDTYTLTVVVN